METVELIKDLGNAVEEFKAKYDERLDIIETAVAKSQFPGGGGSTKDRSTTTAAAIDHENAFYSYVRRGGNDDALRDLEVSAELSTQSDPDGGFLIPETIDRELDRVAPDTMAMRRIARVKGGLRGDYKKPFSKGGATGGWTGETESRSETNTPDLAMFNPAWSEWYALPKVTQTLLDDTNFDVAGWLLDELQIVEEETEGTAFISGNGVKQPKGILAYDTVANAAWEWGKIGYIASGHASQLSDADKLKDLKRSLKPVHRRGGVWLMNDTTFGFISKLKDGNGQYLWRQGLEQDAPDTLLSKPVEIDDNMPDIGAGAFPVAFGDFQRGYLIGDHAVGRRLLRDPYTEKPYVKFYVTKRVFGGVTNFQAIKLLKISAS